jgi:hypothetical protein
MVFSGLSPGIFSRNPEGDRNNKTLTQVLREREKAAGRAAPV